MITYLDACPSCPPGLPDPAPSAGYPEHTPGGLVTTHQCSLCSCAWSALRQDGWVIERVLVPVVPDRKEAEAA